MDRKKTVYLSFFPAAAAGLAVMLYLVLAKGRTDNGVFAAGGIVFAVLAFILYLALGRAEKNRARPDAPGSAPAPAQETGSVRPPGASDAVRALKNYDRNAIDRIDDPEILYQVATVDFSLEEIAPVFYADTKKGKTGSSYGLEEEWSKRTERIYIRRDNAIKAIERLKDPERLEKIVRMEGPFAADAAERLCAVSPESASRLAGDETVTAAVRKAAIQAMTDQDALQNLYRRTEDPELRLGIIGRLTLQPVLEEIADHAEDRELGRAAALKVEDPARRAEYCRKYEAHDWVYDHEERSECGEYLDIDDIYRCRFCGETERREHERIRM